MFLLSRLQTLPARPVGKVRGARGGSGVETSVFARKSMWDSTVSYWSPSVASFVVFLCVCAWWPRFQPTVLCQNNARVGLDR